MRIRIVGPPAHNGRRLPIWGEDDPVVDWWPTAQIERRSTALRKDGVFGATWDKLPSGVQLLAESLVQASGDAYIALWVDAALFELQRGRRIDPVVQGVADAAGRMKAQLLYPDRHAACRSALPYVDGMTDGLLQWLSLENPPYSRLDSLRIVERVVAYAAIRRLMVVDRWTLVTVGAVRDAPPEPREPERSVSLRLVGK